MDSIEIEETIQKGIKALPVYKTNPFLENISIKTRSKRLTVAYGSQLLNSETGEIEGTTDISQIINVDKEEFIKIFTKDLAIWFELNKTGLKVFAALMTIYQADGIQSDLVCFHAEDERIEHFKISKSSWFRGIEELLKKGFIARHIRKNLYYINPALFFNGDRVRFIKEYRKTRK